MRPWTSWGGAGWASSTRHARSKQGAWSPEKMILAGAHAGSDDLARFRREAEAIARLQHPHIVQLYEVGEHEGLPFFSLEFCPGGSLGDKPAGAPLPPGGAAGGGEDLTKGQVGEDAHGEDDPEHDLVGQPEVAAVAPAGFVNGLANQPRGDKLVQADQPIQNRSGQVHLEYQWRLSRHSHSLPEPLCPSKHKLPGGCDLRTG